MKKVDFSETLGACDLKLSRYRQLIEIMMVPFLTPLVLRGWDYYHVN